MAAWVRLGTEAVDVDQVLASHRARRSIVTVACIAASVAAVVAVLSVPGWLLAASTAGPGRPQLPTPTPQEETIGTRGWGVQECPGKAARCQVPMVINLAGAAFLHVGGHRQSVRQRDVASRTLVTSVRAASGRRWLLVGAIGASSASALSVQLGDGEPSALLPGTLTFLSVPTSRSRVQVMIADYGRPAANEVLRVEEYDAVR